MLEISKEELEAIHKLIGETSPNVREQQLKLTQKQSDLIGNLYNDFDNILKEKTTMQIDGQFYFCEGCQSWQPFMGRDVTCDCGFDNKFTEEEYLELEEALDEQD